MNKSKQKASVRRYIWLLPLAALLFLCGVVGLYTYRYRQRFLPGTTIAGVACANMTAAEAAQALRETVAVTNIILGDSSGEQVASIPVTMFLDEAQIEAAARNAFDAQKAGAGLFDWLMPGQRPYPVSFFRDVTAEQAADVLNAVVYEDQPLILPEDAAVELTDEGYEVIPEEPGTAINMEICAAALTEGLHALKTVWPAPAAIIAEKAIVRPKLTAGSPTIKKITNELDSYFLLPVTLDFGDGETYTLTSGDIRSVCDVTIQKSRVKCTPIPEKVRDLIENVVNIYGYDGVYAKFRHVESTRPYAYYRVGDNGWILDRDTMADQVYNALLTRTDAVVTPAYDYTWYWKGVYSRRHLGDTFIEISLDNQYLWAYKNGELIVETPVVTGNIAERCDTNRGFFRIAYKETDLNLRGPTWDDHVDYWMPFDGEIGLHDSSWRSEYGADIYLTDGSHGCVNTPLKAMRLIFRNFNADDVVIVY